MLADLAAVDLARTCFQPVADGNMVEALQLTDHLQFQPLLDDAYAVVQKETKLLTRLFLSFVVPRDQLQFQPPFQAYKETNLTFL